MDIIRCSVKAGLNFRGTKLSWMAVEPRKPRKFSTAKIKVHTVHISVKMAAPWGSLTLLNFHSLCLHLRSLLTEWEVFQNTSSLGLKDLDTKR